MATKKKTTTEKEKDPVKLYTVRKGKVLTYNVLGKAGDKYITDYLKSNGEALTLSKDDLGKHFFLSLNALKGAWKAKFDKEIEAIEGKKKEVDSISA